MSNKVQANSGLKSILHFLTILIIIWSLTPFCRRNISIIFIVALIVLWVVFAFLLKAKNNIKVPIHIFFSIAWLLLIFSYRFIGFSNAAWGNYFNQLLFFMFVWIGDYYIRNMGEYYCTRIFQYTMIIAVINIIHNIYLLFLYPNASVELNFSDIYNGTNIGGTTFSLFTLILLCILLIIIADNSKNLKKWIYMALGTMCVVYIFGAARAIATVFLIITVGIYLYMKLIYKKKQREKMLYVMLSIFLIFLLFINTEYFLRMISSKIGNDGLAIRLNAMANAFSGNISGQDVALLGRLELYKLSISTFFASFKNFIFGVGYHTTTNLSTSWLYTTGVGNHSEFLDLAARYGIIGVLIIYNFFRSFIKNLKKYNQSYYCFKGNIVWIIFLSYSFVNNTFDPSIGALIFLIFPLYLLNRCKYSKKEEVAVNN